MFGYWLSSLLKKPKETLTKDLLKTATDAEQQAQQRHELRNKVWIVVIVGAVIVGGRFLLFKVEGNPFQLPMNARNWTGFGESYDNNVSEVAEKGTEKGTEKDGKTTKETTKETNKIITTQKKLQPAKTLWDWMGLLLAPATLAGLGFLFQYSQEKAKRDKEEADKKRDADQQREQALQAYFEQLSVLLVDKRVLKLHEKAKQSTNSETEASSNKSESKIDVEETEIDANAALDVVKAKTLTLFRLFDNADPTDMPRKASVLAFLGDTGLLKAMSRILDLSGSHWEKANLRRANLSGAKLSNAKLSSAKLSNAKLIGADLSGAKLIGADLSGAKLIGADLSGADLSGAKLIGADLSGADLSGAKLIGADLSGAKLNDTNLSNTNLSDAKLSNANLVCANLNDAKLVNAKLSNADFSGAILIGADLWIADLSNAYFNDTDLSDAKLSNANLSNADFSSAILIGADLRFANLSSAILSSAILLGTDFTQTKGLVQQQLEGKDPPLLCNVKLPEGIAVDSNHDCKKLPEVLLRRDHEYFKNLVKAQKYVNKYSNP